MGVPSIAVIDHWVNYQARFIREGVTALPDQIWVADPYAATIARACFPAIDVLTYPNHYLARLAQEITPLSQAGDDLLYVFGDNRIGSGGPNGNGAYMRLSIR